MKHSNRKPNRGLIKSCKLLFGTLLLVCFLNGCKERKKFEKVKKYTSRNFPGSKILFAMEDMRYDDYGSGNYIYPYNQNFKKGTFDLTGFLVYKTKDHLNFEIEMDRFIPVETEDGQSQANGFLYHNIDIYIDMDRRRDSGFTRTLPGRNISILPQCGWEKMILICPEDARSVERQIQAKSDDLDLINKRLNIIVADDIEVRQKRFIVRIPLSKLKQAPSRSWGYQVLITKYQNQQGPDNFKVSEVRAIPDEQHFGGGSALKGSSNVIDLLLPQKISQKRLLKNFRSSRLSSRRNYARVPCVYLRRKN